MSEHIDRYTATARGAPCWTVTGDSNADSAKTITKAAVAGEKHYITAFSVVVTAAVTDDDIPIQLLDGATLKWKEFLPNASPRGTAVSRTFPEPIAMTVNTAANLTVGAAGTSAIVTLNLEGYTNA